MNPEIQKIDRILKSPVFRVALPVLIILLYIAGMFMMIFQNFGNGVTLWVLSTVLGALVLYVKRTQEKKRTDLLQAEEDERAYQAAHGNEEKEQEQN